MFLTPDDIGELILLAVAAVLATQFAYGCTFLLLERTMLDFYDLSIYRPATTVFQKIQNIFQKGLLGSGYYIYTKIGKYNWFVRKILFLLALSVQRILSIGGTGTVLPLPTHKKRSKRTVPLLPNLISPDASNPQSSSSQTLPHDLISEEQ